MHYFSNLRSARIEGSLIVIHTYEGEGTIENPGREVVWVLTENGQPVAVDDPNGFLKRPNQMFRDPQTKQFLFPRGE